MAERASATITIGGDMPASLTKAFMELVRDAGAGPDYDGGVDFLFTGKHRRWTARKRVEFLAKHHGTAWLHLEDSEAVGGMFEDLEEWLKSNNIPFDRHSDAHWEWGALNTYFRPGPEGEALNLDMDSDYHGNDVVNAHRVRAAREALAEGNAHAALKHLDEELGLGAKIPELPPFRIVNG